MPCQESLAYLCIADYVALSHLVGNAHASVLVIPCQRVTTSFHKSAPDAVHGRYPSSLVNTENPISVVHIYPAVSSSPVSNSLIHYSALASGWAVTQYISQPSSPCQILAMSSYIPQTNLWIERSRLAGMVLEGVFYGASSINMLRTQTDVPQQAFSFSSLHNL